MKGRAQEWFEKYQNAKEHISKLEAKIRDLELERSLVRSALGIHGTDITTDAGARQAMARR